MMNMDQYLSMFIDESKEYLQALNENILALENNPEDVGIVQHIFRSAHTLKGMSATMRFEDLAALTHDMENVLDLVRKHKLKMDPFIFDCLFQSLDAMDAMVEDIVQGGTGKADVTGIVKALQSIVSEDYINVGKAESISIGNAEARPEAELDMYQLSILQQTGQTGLTSFRITVTVNKDCVLKAPRAYMVFQALEEHGEIIQTIPSIEDIEQERFDTSFTVYYVSRIGQEELDKQISGVSEIERVELVELDRAKLEELAKPLSEVAAATVTVKAVQSARTGTDRQAAGSDAGKTPTQERAPVANRTIRVDIDRLDALMNLFSELLIDRVRLEQLASVIRRIELTETVENMARVSGELQDIVLKLRMVPVDTVFNRFPRMIRDTAKALDKKVNLVISGAETELDRTVIEEIGDPLVHLLRNAVDHGMEPARDRLATGKPESGTIHLRAYHSSNHVFIEIEDDGRGINREAVLEKAIQNGLLTAEQAMRMVDEDVYMLLFASGFSTAETISDLSGRGVGLDVVKSKIEKLGGSVQVQSELGKGTRFSVQLPLTLSIISAMLIGLQGEKYAIPLSSIVETMAVRNEQIHTVRGSRVIHHRDSVVPLVHLARLFEVPGASEELAEETKMVIIRKGDKLAALIVDEFIGQQEIVIKPLGPYLKSVFFVSGATILGDGLVSLIIDTNTLIN